MTLRDETLGCTTMPVNTKAMEKRLCQYELILEERKWFDRSDKTIAQADQTTASEPETHGLYKHRAEA